MHRHRYFGVLAPNSPLRAAVTAMTLAAPAQPATAQAEPATTGEGVSGVAPAGQRCSSAAILGHGGPYAPYLEVASAMESPDTQATHALCAEHQLSHEEVNRALLQTLSTVKSHRQ